MTDIKGTRGYTIIWEFRPRAGVEARFREAYGPRGIWARFFAIGEGFVTTELNQDLKDPGRYVTLDFWVSQAACEAFLAAHAEEYKTIDLQCEELTVEEKLIGHFERLP